MAGIVTTQAITMCPASPQRTAEGLREIDRLYRAGRYQEAYDLALIMKKAGLAAKAPAPVK